VDKQSISRQPHRTRVTTDWYSVCLFSAVRSLRSHSTTAYRRGFLDYFIEARHLFRLMHTNRPMSKWSSALSSSNSVVRWRRLRQVARTRDVLRRTVIRADDVIGMTTGAMCQWTICVVLLLLLVFVAQTTAVDMWWWVYLGTVSFAGCCSVRGNRDLSRTRHRLRWLITLTWTTSTDPIRTLMKLWPCAWPYDRPTVLKASSLQSHMLTTWSVAGSRAIICSRAIVKSRFYI